MDPTNILVRQLVLCLVAALCAVGAVAARPSTAPPAAAAPAVVPVKAAPATLTVPSVVGIAFVFAKSQLTDDGFSWRVAGPVHGYAANTVVGQSPAPGTVVVDTGAPPVTVRLRHNGTYVEDGTPQDRSPFRSTRLRLAH